jgi:hypothetical protein
MNVRRRYQQCMKSGRHLAKGFLLFAAGSGVSVIIGLPVLAKICGLLALLFAVPMTLEFAIAWRWYRQLQDGAGGN